MPALNERERKTVRMAVILVGIYLALFGGIKLYKVLAVQRADYGRVLAETRALRAKVQPYETRAAMVKKLMESSKIDPMRLARTSVVAEASAALQKTATSGGIQLGTIRESPSRTASKEIGSIQLEANGSVSALLGFLHRFQSVGYPLLLDQIQITSEPSKPGMLKLHLTIIVLDFEQWKQEEQKHA
jgi:hypothetical protein